MIANMRRGITRKYQATPSMQNMAVSSMSEWLTEICRLMRCSSSRSAPDSSISCAIMPAPYVRPTICATSQRKALLGCSPQSRMSGASGRAILLIMP